MEAAAKSPDGVRCDRRLFVGGLHHDATELEVEKRFRPFGEVGCITLKTRRDETGHPTKTFAYVDLCATEGQLHKCVSVLNRSEWKSNLLQVELAKESFLQRLARERANGDQSSKFKSALSESSKGSSQVLKSPQVAETPTFHRKEIVLGTDVSNTKRRFDSTGEQVTSSTQISVDPKWRQNAVDEGNRRRLEALEEHQRMAEARKKLVHAALHFKGRMTRHDPSHIIFDSSFEVDGDTQDDSVQLETSGKESRKVAEAGKLFDSEDDDDDDDELFMGEDNNIRPGADYLNCFQVKPQFEGKKGQKLLELQARLASDPRFRLDSRFLEDEGKDDEDEEENVGILVGTDQVESSKLVQQLPPSVCAASKRVFRDTSTLHFDPLQEGHAQFEVKHQVKKKRLDPCTDVKQLKENPCHEDKTQTLPSVSAETFYNVSSDLKQLLTSEVGSRTVGILTDHLEEEGNKDDEEDDAVADEEEEGVVTEVLSHQDDHSCRSFRFSFFDTESTSNTRADMNCTTSRVSKSAPSRSHLHNLHSSSSDDDCDDVQKLQGTDNGVAAVKSFSSRQTGMVTKPPFFFFANDPRLREGPDLFCRNAAPQRADGEWQELVVTLREHSQKRRREAIRHTRARPQ